MPDRDNQKSSVPAGPGVRIVRPNFITEIIDEDLRTGRVEQVVTRFPPEPNGYLHLGHLKAIVLDFGVADDYGGRTNLRFDDTNPTTENEEYVEAQKADLHWLGFDWDLLVHASDYFEQLYGYAQKLIRDGKAFVDSLSEEEIREYRGTVTEPGRESPYRDRSPEENLDLFERMRRGEFPDGAHVLRARIDMSSRNMLMRDPLLYRIRHARHYRTGSDWHIYPMYDFAHPLSDAIEGVTHSLCTLEYENNRELYDWVLENTVDPPHPHQYEFARLSLEYTVLSKRRLIQLVQGGFVSGWDDPRMPTLIGMRRRGMTPEALRDFVNRVGVTRANSRTDMALLEHSLRDDLNDKAPRVMAVLEPLKVELSNYPESEIQDLDAPYWPHDVPREGSRRLPFGRELYIDRSDFAEEPPKGWRRLSPGESVRLRHAYVIRCDEVVRNESGEITLLRCSYDPETLNRNPEGSKPRGTIHWVEATEALPARFRLFDRLFDTADPGSVEGDFTEALNENSLVERRGYVEPSVGEDDPDTRYQFERLGYFWRDPVDSSPEGLVFNRIVTLKDSWAQRDGAARSSGKGNRRSTGGGKGTTDTSAGDEAAVSRANTSGRASGQREESRPDPVTELSPRQKTIYNQYRDLLGVESADAALLASNEELSQFFDAAVEHHDNPRAIANWVVNELMRELKGRSLHDLALSGRSLAELVALIDRDVVSARAAKEVFARMLEQGGEPEAIVDELNLRQVSDEGAIVEVVGRLIDENPDKVDAYRAGKTGLAGFFVGQVMRETGGRANPQLVKELVERELTAG